MKDSVLHLTSWVAEKKEVTFTYDALTSPPLQPGDQIQIAGQPFLVRSIEQSEGEVTVTAQELLVSETSLRERVRAKRDLARDIRGLLAGMFPEVTDELVCATVALLRESVSLAVARDFKQKCSRLGVPAENLDTLISTLQGKAAEAARQTIGEIAKAEAGDAALV